MKYQVIVGNVGTVLDTDDQAKATATFQEYVWKSVEQDGRVSGEPVTLMRDGEPLAEFGANDG